MKLLSHNLIIKKILRAETIILSIFLLSFLPELLNNKGIIQGQEDLEMTCPTEVHIGEAVDETEDYIASLLPKYQRLYDNAINAQNSASTSTINAQKLIEHINGRPSSAWNEADSLISLADTTNCQSCDGGNCTPGTCTCTIVWESGRSAIEAATRPGCESPVCSVWGPWPPCPCPPYCFAFCPPRPCLEYTYTCPKCAYSCGCSNSTGEVCPMPQINVATSSLAKYYASSTEDYEKIYDAYTNIKDVYNPAISNALSAILNLTNSVTPGQIRAKLDAARKELMKCFTPSECTEQLIAGERKCIINGSTFIMQFLYTCDTITNISEINKPRCDYETANLTKANNFFCCEVIY